MENDTNVGPGMIYDSPDEKEIMKLERKNYAQAAQIRVLQETNAKLLHDRSEMFVALEEWEFAYCGDNDPHLTTRERNQRLEKARQRGVETLGNVQKRARFYVEESGTVSRERYESLLRDPVIAYAPVFTEGSKSRDCEDEDDDIWKPS